MQRPHRSLRIRHGPTTTTCGASASCSCNRNEIRKIAQALEAGGRALVPLRLYFKGALVKVEVALGTGKKQFDKREDLKKRAELRDRERTFRFRR